jgi:hypothetical protein
MANASRATWPTISAWILSGLLALFLGFAFSRGASWSEAETLAWSAGFFVVVGMAFIAASQSPNEPALFRYLVRAAQRQKRWLRLGGFLTQGEPLKAGLLCLVIGAVLGVLSRLL